MEEWVVFLEGSSGLEISLLTVIGSFESVLLAKPGRGEAGRSANGDAGRAPNGEAGRLLIESVESRDAVGTGTTAPASSTGRVGSLLTSID